MVTYCLGGRWHPARYGNLKKILILLYIIARIARKIISRVDSIDV